MPDESWRVVFSPSQRGPGLARPEDTLRAVRRGMSNFNPTPRVFLGNDGTYIVHLYGTTGFLERVIRLFQDRFGMRKVEERKLNP
jgi:hypothetical protein